MPLLFTNENDHCVVVELRGGKEFKAKCIDQGIIPGAQLIVRSVAPGGACVVELNGSRIALGQSMRSRIMVTSS